MKAVFTPAADADLEAIGDYIAEDNAERAVSFVRELRVHCQAVGDAPLAHASRPDLGRDIRCCPHGNYLILYRARQDEVLIVRVLHAARDVRRLARRGLDLNEPAARYAVSDFEALGFLRAPSPRSFSGKLPRPSR